MIHLIVPLTDINNSGGDVVVLLCWGTGGWDVAVVR